MFNQTQNVGARSPNIVVEGIRQITSMFCELFVGRHIERLL